MIIYLANMVMWFFIITGSALTLALVGDKVSKFHAEGMARVAKYNTKLEDK